MTILKFKLQPTLLALLAGALLPLNACKKDETSGGTGQLNLEITDCPADDPNVTGVFVTIAELKGDG